MPAASVEVEAKDRLGLETEADGRIIEAAIALRYLDVVGEAQDLLAALSEARLSYCVFTENGGHQPLPRVRLAGRLCRGPGRYDSPGLRSAARRRPGNYHPAGGHRWRRQNPRTNWAGTRPGMTAAIANLLGMANVPQTRPHGLRNHRQRPRIPRSDCRHARPHPSPSRMPVATV